MPAHTILFDFDGTLADSAQCAILAALKAQQRQTGIVSSKKTAILRANCEQLGISAHIDVFIGSDTVQHYKPHPEGIRLALAALDGDPATALYIGDATTDIEMGHAAGVKTCAVTWGAHDKAALAASAPDFVVEDVAALQRLLLA